MIFFHSIESLKYHSAFQIFVEFDTDHPLCDPNLDVLVSDSNVFILVFPGCAVDFGAVDWRAPRYSVDLPIVDGE